MKQKKQNFEYLLKQAEQGDSEAQYDLGLLYYNGGEGFPKDGCEAIKWFRLSAEQGNANGQFGLGMCYKYGIGITEDRKEAVKWIRQAAENDHFGAIRRIYGLDLGWCGVESTKEGLKRIKKFAKQGNPEAQFDMGYCYESGDGVTHNYEKAIKWYKLSAEQGNEYSQYRLGELSRLGIINMINDEDAAKLFKMSADQGCAQAQCSLGVCYLNGIGVAKNDIEAIKLIKMSAEQEYIDACLILGWLYFYGRGVNKNVEEAISWYRKAAIQGDPQAQYKLIECYLYGRGTSKNIEEAKKWFEAYHEGCEDPYEKYWIGFPWDDEKSVVKWFSKLAEQGDSNAQYHLGLCYLLGYGIDNNVDEAVKWLRKATNDEIGYNDAQEELDDITNNCNKNK